MKTGVLFLIILTCCFRVVATEILEDFENLDGWKKDSKYSGKLEKAPDTAVGKGALKVSYPIITAKNIGRNDKKRRDWDKKYKGMAFWVKGDGSENWGSLSIGGSGWSYIYYFPLKNKDWHRIVIPWSDLTPQWHISQGFNTKGALTPSGVSFIRIGNTWKITHRNQRLKPFSYCLDQLEFVEDLGDSKTADVSKFAPASFEEVIKKCKNGESVTIYCLGDSITAGSGLKTPALERYSVLLQKRLREHFKNDKITVQSRAVGGARVNNCIAWLERDFSDKIPDMITYMIGYNNKSGAHSTETFERQLNNYIDRVTEKSKGKTAILLITTIPGKGHRYNMQDDYAEVVKKIGVKRGLPVCDVAKEFKKIGRDGMEEYMRDSAHPNDKGHRVFADTLYKYIIQK